MQTFDLRRKSPSSSCIRFVGSLLAFGLLAPSPSLADIPRASYTQSYADAAHTASVRKLMGDAQKALAEGKVRLAVILLKNAVGAAPRNTDARIMLGTALLRLGDEPGAEHELRQARKDGAASRLVLPPLFQAMLVRNESQMLLDLFPDPGPSSRAAEAPDVLMARALALQKLQRGPEAIAAMDRSLELRRDATGVLNRARLALIQGDYATAGRFVDEVLQNWPDNTDAMLFKVELLLAEKDNTAALALANQMTSAFPGNLAGRFARVETYIRMNQDAQAKAEVDSILAKSPDLLMGIYYRALLLARAGDSKGAWGVAQVLPGDFRDSNPGITAVVAQMAINAGAADLASSMLARILRDHPEQLAIRIRLAKLRLQQNGTASALNILEPARDSTDPRVARLYAMIYLQTHRPKDALDALRKLNAGNAASMIEKRALALLEMQSGNAEQAIKVLAPAVAAQPGNPLVVEPYIDVLIQKRRYSDALKVADEFGSYPKQREQGLVHRGNILVQQGNAAGARAALDKAVAIDPRSKSALYARASLLITVQKYGEATRDLENILALDSRNIAAVMKLAEIAERRGDDSRARMLLGQAITLSPKLVGPRIALALYLVTRGDMKGALAAAQDCASVQPNNDECALLLGKTQLALGQNKAAVASFRRLVSLRPDLASAQLLLSEGFWRVHDRTSAARAIDAAVELAPEEEAVRLAQINFKFRSGDTNAAVALARDFQSSQPGTIADLTLAQSLERANHNDEAAAILNESFSKRPDRLALMELVHLALISNDRKRAGALMSKWLVNKPDDAAVRMKYASFLSEQDDRINAIAQLEILVKRAPNNIDAINNLAWLIQDKDPMRAQALLSHALKLSPNSAHAADTLGWLKLQRKDISGALALLSRAHQMQPANPTITYHLIVALDAGTKRGEALTLLKPLLSGGAQFADRPEAQRLYATWLR